MDCTLHSIKETADYVFIGYQEWPGHDDIALYNLKIDTINHPKGSTVSESTLIELGLL